MDLERDRTNAPRLLRSEPIFSARSVAETVAFYRQVLGFAEEWLWGDPPTFGGVRWGKIGVMFGESPERAARIEGHEHSFFAEGIDELYALHLANGARIISPLEAKPWGLREYTVRDLNGYYLRFGEPGSDRPRSGPMPEAVSIVERRPTIEEYLALIDAVGWSDSTDREAAPAAIGGALHGVVAVENGRATGAGLVVGDGATFFYLKDVMVHPDRQSRQIGTAIVASLMRYIRATASPQALVGLFTGRNLGDFYERFGFQGSDDGLYGMSQRLAGQP